MNIVEAPKQLDLFDAEPDAEDELDFNDKDRADGWLDFGYEVEEDFEDDFDDEYDDSDLEDEE